MKNSFLTLFFLLPATVALAQPTPQAATLIKSFRQGEAGNCASISVIKLAIDKYGEQGVLQHLDSTDTAYNITLRDGTSLVLTKAERRQLSTFDHFAVSLEGGNTSILKTAKFLYAVMAKNKFLTANRQAAGTYASVTDAAHFKDNNGDDNWLLVTDTAENFKLLGLGNNYATLSRQQAKMAASVILANLKHSAYSSKDSYDEMGTVARNSMFKLKHGFWSFTWYYLTS